MVTFEASMRIVCHKLGDKIDMYTNRRDVFRIPVPDASYVDVHAVQEEMIASCLEHDDLASKGYKREDVAVLHFEIPS